MPSSPLGSTRCCMMLGVTCHLCLWKTHTVGRHQAWHAIIALGHNTWSDYVGRGMQSWLLESIQSRMTSGIACYHLPWTTHMIGLRRAWKCYNYPCAAHTVEQRRALNAIISLGKHLRWDYVGCDMLLCPFESITDRTTSDVSCYNHIWIAHTNGRHWAWECYQRPL